MSARSLAMAIFLAFLGACSSSTWDYPQPIPTCPNDLPASCPSPPPSYSADIAPVVEAHCTVCHSAGGPAAEKPTGSYDDLFRQRSRMLDQIYGCEMPPPSDTADGLTKQQRQQLLAWFVCGAPND